MPTLDWIGKDAVVRHHKEVPFRLLETDRKFSCGDPDSGNPIVEADYLLDLGDAGGDAGGRGTPEQVAKSKTFRTAPFLKAALAGR